MNLNDTFNLMTTLVVASSDYGRSQGTAFFYHHLAPKDGEGPQWRTVQGVWLITNRHVLLPIVDDSERVPRTLTFHLRKVVDAGLEWEPLTLTEQDLRQRCRLHPDPSADVATVQVSDLLIEKAKEQQVLQWQAVGPENFAGNDNIEVEASDDVLIIGYPRGFYDRSNLYPIVKSGIIASRWGAHFDGSPHFLVDAKLFPGSSGSIVISKPTDMVVKDGKLLHATEKKFAFLGIFSGEPLRESEPVDLEDLVIVRKAGYNVGITWYGELVEEILAGDEHLPS